MRKILLISDGRLTDNFVDCCEFVAEVLWAQGYQTIPTADCLQQYNWLKENGEVGNNFEDVKVGDIIFWDNTLLDGAGKDDVDYRTKENFDHVGIVTEISASGGAKFIHASVNKDRTTKIKKRVLMSSIQQIKMAIILLENLTNKNLSHGVELKNDKRILI